MTEKPFIPVLFLDIDGVLNSSRSSVALGGFPFPEEPENWPILFDMVAVGLLQRVIKHTGAVCVLSSTWRNHCSLEVLGGFLKVPIIDKTCPSSSRTKRGDEILSWLKKHPLIKKWAIVDDVDDMLEDQKHRFVKTDTDDGLTYAQHWELIRILKS